MVGQTSESELRLYSKNLNREYETGKATEHSYRPALKTLLEAFGGAGVKALNEPSHVECGAPDFIVERDGIPIGHVECKDIGANLDAIEKSEQLKRYRDGLPNLILTNYLEFRWYSEGQFRESGRLAHITSPDKIKFDKAGAQQVLALLESFIIADTPSVSNPRDLAQRMASKARILRDGVNRVLHQESDLGPLHGLLAAYQEVLIKDLSVADFADLQAQTAAYGMFAARCHHNPASGSFTRQSAVFAETTPFLREIFGQIAGPGIDPRIAWIVDELALLLDRTDMNAILSDFGSRTVQEDPVVHFYEDFLAAYDPELREMRGVYYTPEPVVSYIVRSIDYLLRTRFHLVDGLADTAKVKTDLAGERQEENPRVLILDPAAGTGTFLREVISFIRGTIEGKGLAGAWSNYVHEHLLPRLFGFELLMAPYAICHLKLALEIAGTKARFAMPASQRLNVFLTNTLEKPDDAATSQIVLMAHELAREASGADAVKREKPVMVILGNPPYSGHSANKGAWIKGLLRGKDGVEDTWSYFEVDGGPLVERTSKWLNDDYVKFIRFAQWRIERTGEGVLGFVTNHSYLDNPTFRGMRQSLMKTFDEIYLLDLHGNSKKKESSPEGERDENVFDIQQGVAIGLFVKHRQDAHGTSEVFHAELWGQRDAGQNGGKYGWLLSQNMASTKWTKLEPKSPHYLFVPRDERLAREYAAYYGLKNAFPINGAGITTAHDGFVINFDGTSLVKKFEHFRDSERNSEILHSEFDVKKKSGWNILDGWDNLQNVEDLTDFVKSFNYRPFDKRFIFYENKLVWRTVRRVMSHMIGGSNIGLVTTRQCQRDWSVLATDSVIGHKALAAYDINSLFPLYTYPTKEQEQVGLERQPNLNEQFVKKISNSIGLSYISEGSGDLCKSFGPEDVFHYIYGVLHSPEYRRRYADFLKSDFPRIPVTSNYSLFMSLANLGKRLASLHLMESAGVNLPSFPKEGDNNVQRAHYAPPTGSALGRVLINRDQYFEGVTPETWEFSIGGYNPAEKWLKDRKGRVLSYDDILHYRRICAVLSETPRIMASIDTEIENHGGWPLS